MNRLTALVPPAALGAALLLGAPAPGAAAERFTLSGGNVAVWNIAGKTEIVAGTGSDVVVLVERAGRDAARLRMETSPVRDRSGSLRVIYPDDRIVYPPMGRWSNSNTHIREDGTFGGDSKGWFDKHRITVAGGGSGLEAHADLRVMVPKGRKVAVFTIAGPATIANVDGDITFDGGSSTATADHVKGRLVLDLGSGEARVTDLDGDLIVDTGSGGIDIQGVRGTSVSLDTGSGGVDADDLVTGSLLIDTGSGGVTATGIKADEVSVDTGSGHVRLEFLSNARSVSVDTGSGGCTMQVPPTFNATFTVDTGSGGIRSSLPLVIERKDSDSLRARLGDGRGNVRIETGSGGVVLAAAGAR